MTPAPTRRGAGGARTGSALVAIGAAVVALAVIGLLLWQTLGPPAPGEDLTWQTPPPVSTGPSDGGGEAPRALPQASGGERESDPAPQPDVVSSTPTPTSTSSSQPTPTDSSTSTSTPTQGVTSAAPSSLRIASAGIEVPLVHLGLASDGTINPPQGVTQYFTGFDRVVPGRTGTAVIAAHVAYSGVPDAFANLHRVVPGDQVTISYQDGSVRTFTVKDTFIADKDDLTSNPTVWGGNSQVPRLAIITCDPALDYDDAGHALGNLVVIAE